MNESFTTPELTPVSSCRLSMSECPGCDTTLDTKDLDWNEETVCPHCKVVLLWVRIDHTSMFIRDGWT